MPIRNAVGTTFALAFAASVACSTGSSAPGPAPAPPCAEIGNVCSSEIPCCGANYCGSYTPGAGPTCGSTPLPSTTTDASGSTSDSGDAQADEPESGADTGSGSGTGKGSDSGSGSGTGSGSGSGSGSGTGSGSVDAGLACPPASTTSYSAAPYVDALGHQGQCTSVQIAEFVQACGNGGTQVTCSAWQTSNNSADGGPNCKSCIIAPSNNGGIWVDPEMFFSPNYAGCVQLSDPTHGPACAASINAVVGCNAVACDLGCRGLPPPDETACVQATDNGSCSTYYQTQQAQCAGESGPTAPFTTCFPSLTTGNSNDDLVYVIGYICGS